MLSRSPGLAVPLALEVMVDGPGSPAGGGAQAYTIGAPAATRPMEGGGQSRASAALDGRVLVLTDVTGTPDVSVTRTDRWALSPDGRTLTVDRTVANSGFGSSRVHAVFAKSDRP